MDLGVREWDKCFVIFKFVKKAFAGDINSTNLPCLTSVLPGDTFDSRNSSYKTSVQIDHSK